MPSLPPPPLWSKEYLDMCRSNASGVAVMSDLQQKWSPPFSNAEFTGSSEIEEDGKMVFRCSPKLEFYPQFCRLDPGHLQHYPPSLPPPPPLRRSPSSSFVLPPGDASTGPPAFFASSCILSSEEVSVVQDGLGYLRPSPCAAFCSTFAASRVQLEPSFSEEAEFCRMAFLREEVSLYAATWQRVESCNMATCRRALSPGADFTWC